MAVAFGDFDFAMMMSFFWFINQYTNKSSILLENRLVIVTEDGTLAGDSHSRNAPNVTDEEKS